ncbi:MAG: hypothetical protein GEV28_08335 [Actinophytocola sp.]|uniref:hypothetical protein n=1 Tax=Actinophytocola sp. TaxID=1872138 RepID=UPI001323BCC7|nr:hypothetical protein [Actinophytocola sp.]MPZ80387.1 hypothetical protein [Actinophytocola sp.]
MTQDSPGGDDPERTRSAEEPTQSTGDRTVALGSDSPTTTGPTVASWSLDDLMREPPPGPLVWHAEPHPSFDNTGLRETRGAGYYVSLTVAVMVVLGLVGLLAFLSVNRPVTQVAGSATGLPIPELPSPTSSTPQTEPSTSSSAAPPADDPLAELARHPLSSSPSAMAPLSCALPRFDPADTAQASFYEAAKVCADGGFGRLLPASGLPAVSIRVVTVHGGPADSPCGAVAPTDPSTQCADTVYMTPAHLRDDEGLDRFPGKYFGVFLREYAKAVLYVSGLTELVEKAKDTPDAPDNLDERLAQQATCLAGIASGAMAGLGAVDTNITNEIRERLTSVDAPPDAATWLTKGFESLQPASCNTWT